MRRIGIRNFCLLAVTLQFPACAPPAPPDEPPSVLLITIDTTRRDHLSLYGYPRPTTPFLEELASEGTRFEQAYAPTATTGPTHASLFTSLYPPAHAVVKNGFTLADAHVTLAERLAKHDYQTAAVVSSYVLDRRFGFGQGFDSYDDALTRQDSTIQTDSWEGHEVENGFDRRADATTELALVQLERLRVAPRPFFLFVHYFDPHSPYVPPPSVLDRFDREEPGSLRELIRRYDAEIAFVDQQLRRLVEGLTRLALDRKTVVVLTADHGEGLMDHGHLEHGVHIYEEAVRVPLLFRWPGRIAAGGVLETPVELLDVVPTLLEFAGLESSMGQISGRSLAAALRGGPPLDSSRPVFLFRRHYADAPDQPLGARGVQFGVRSGRWKYIEAPAEDTRELFDLTTDPSERNNLLQQRPGVGRELAQLLSTWRERHPAATQSEEIPDDVRSRLEALGYLQ